MVKTTTLTRREATLAVDQRHWRVVERRLVAVYGLPDYPTGAGFVARVAAAAQEADHHPDVLLRYGSVVVTTSSHDVGGLTRRDVDLAATVAAIADELGLTPAPGRVQDQEIAIDAMDIPAVRAFWKAVLGYDDDGDEALVDPIGVGPGYWFQQMDQPRPQRNRIHVDVIVAHDEALARIEATVAAGGRLLSDAALPAFWILADPEGNEACICTWRGREDDDRGVPADPGIV